MLHLSKGQTALSTQCLNLNSEQLRVLVRREKMFQIIFATCLHFSTMFDNDTNQLTVLECCAVGMPHDPVRPKHHKCATLQYPALQGHTGPHNEARRKINE